MKPITAVLHPTDFSASSAHALGIACAVARDHHARLVLLHVVPPPNGDGERMRNHVAHRMERLEELQRLPLPHLEGGAECIVRQGPVADAICRAARELKCGLIVMGMHGWDGPAYSLMGNVAAAVARRAPCTVVAVNDPAPLPRKKSMPRYQTPAS